jgi:hypothetical protein
MIASVWLDSYRRLLNLRAAIWSGHALLVAWWLCHAQWRSRASKGYELDGAEQCRGYSSPIMKSWILPPCSNAGMYASCMGSSI